jgi:RNase P subunit RPR2
MQRFLKKLFCKHRNVKLIRWCIKHIPDYEPSCVVVEYQCNECGKFIYRYLYERDKAEWIKAMGEYKHEDFYCTR